ncbi:MAG TPA: 4a-hydroxytetrahydrobiopterin dehydratase [Thermoanaerobaculia bacterium]
MERPFELRTFAEAFSFMTELAFAAERRNHHPDWSNVYNRVIIRLSGGITERDHELAKEINEIYG